MTENTRRTRPALPTFLTQPATADLVTAVLFEGARDTDRSHPVGAALGTTLDNVVRELVDGGFASTDPRRTQSGSVRSAAFGTGTGTGTGTDG